MDGDSLQDLLMDSAFALDQPAIAGSDGVCLVETKTFALVHHVKRVETIIALSWEQSCLAVSDSTNKIVLIEAGNGAAESGRIDDVLICYSKFPIQLRPKHRLGLREGAFRDVDEDDSQTLIQEVKSQTKVKAVAFSRKTTSSYLAYASDDCSLSIMTTRDWKIIFQIDFSRPVRSLAFSYSSNLLCMGGDEYICYVLSVPTRSMILNAIVASQIQCVAFSRQDERLSIGMEDGVVSLLVVDAEFEPSGEIDHDESAVLCQDWCSMTFVVGRRNGNVSLFDAGKVFCNIFVPLAEFSSNYAIRSLAFGVSERLLATSGDSGVSILSRKGDWILRNQINTESTVFTTKWSPAGRYLAFAGSDEEFHVCDTITWAATPKIQQLLPKNFDNSSTVVSCIDWSLDCRLMAIGTIGSGIRVLDPSDWTLFGPTTDGLSLGRYH